MYRKKSLGQHFLRSRGALEKIIAAANLSPVDTVLEVGPGEGVLTELLLEKAGRVISVEKDDRLIPALREKFAKEIASSKLELVHSDILNLNPSDYKLEAKSYKLAANLPYYITGQFLRKFLESERQPQSMVLLLQKEVAERIIARDGRESILSISVKAYGTPRSIVAVKAGSFVPPPKVDSAIISISNISKKSFSNLRAEDFFAMLKKGFAHPRKLISSNLRVPKEMLAQCGIAEKARPENLSGDDWKRLCKAISTRQVEVRRSRD